MKGYESGEQPDHPGIIKLNTNENPYPPSPNVAEVLKNFDTRQLRRYPSPRADHFRDCAAHVHQINRNNIVATRGGDELLRLLLTTFVDPGDYIGMTDPTYSLYPVLTAIQDGRCKAVPLADNWSLPGSFADELNQSNCKLSFLVNPHAPSGYLLAAEEISQIAASLTGLLVVDEAYINFINSPDYDLTQIAIHSENIVLLRTLSKGYSLAGLRFGYGIGPAHLIDPIVNKTKDSFNLDAISQELAAAAISDQTYARNTWAKVSQQRQFLQKALSELGFYSPVSHTNFLLVTVPSTSKRNAQQLYQALKSENILVRYFPEQRLSDKLRITIGTADENARLLSTLKALLKPT
jgi:histidinol-phosphate aminotransferase